MHPLLTLVHKYGQEIARLPRPSEVHDAHISKSDDADDACAKIGRFASHIWWAGCPPRSSSRAFASLEVGGVIALGAPAGHRYAPWRGFRALAQGLA